MIAWLLDHQSAVQFCALLGAFVAIALWETVRPLRAVTTATSVRWINNLLLAALGGVLARLAFPLAGVAFAAYAAQHQIGLLNAIAIPSWFAIAVAVPILDAAEYAIHRALHAAPWLWRIHKIHHSELDVDCMTAVRHHPLEYLLVGALDLAVIGALGAPAAAVLIASILTVATSVFNHGNVTLAPAFERSLRRVLVTPDFHRIHHSTADDECNANYSMVFSWWDRWFGTWRDVPRIDHAMMSLGLADVRAAGDITFVKLLAMPFRRERDRALA